VRGVRKLVGFNRCFRGPEVCRYVEASTRPRENLLHVHTPLVRTKRARIFLLSISRGSQRFSRKSVPRQRVSLPPPPPPPFFLSCLFFFSFIRSHARDLSFPLVAHSQRAHCRTLSDVNKFPRETRAQKCFAVNKPLAKHAGH